MSRQRNFFFFSNVNKLFVTSIANTHILFQSKRRDLCTNLFRFSIVRNQVDRLELIVELSFYILDLNVSLIEVSKDEVVLVLCVENVL